MRKCLLFSQIIALICLANKWKMEMENTKAKISREKNMNILRKKYGREIINNDIIKLLMVR